jgi:hypothetical protein
VRQASFLFSYCSSVQKRKLACRTRYKTATQRNKKIQPDNPQTEHVYGCRALPTYKDPTAETVTLKEQLVCLKMAN